MGSEERTGERLGPARPGQRASPAWPASVGHDVALHVFRGVGDLLDLSTRTQYEIELHPHRAIRDRKLVQYRPAGHDVIIVDCSALPHKPADAARHMKRYVVPD